MTLMCNYVYVFAWISIWKAFSLRENVENAFNTISISTKSQGLFNTLESTLA